MKLKEHGKKVVQKFLERLVRIKLSRMHPKIIGITGSYGKTSTKDAVSEVLKTKWRVYRDAKSLNTEIGLLLAVLEQPSGFSSPVKWSKILAAATWNAFFGKHRDFLILEYGADKPGDIEHLISLVKPDVAIITKIARVHQAEGQFKNEKDVFEEKKKLAACLQRSDVAILNFEDPQLQKLEKKLDCAVLWWNRDSGFYAEHLEYMEGGFKATIRMGSRTWKAKFHVPGTYHINIFLPALACGMIHGVSVEEGVEALQNFSLPPGRMTFIPGINGSQLLDSTYNASPETMKEALRLLREIPAKRKIAVLGNMNELGEYTSKAHRELAHEIDDWLDGLVTVGEWASLIAEEALKNGFPKRRIKILMRAEDAGEYLKKELRHGDLVLFKGSQNLVRLERAVKILMEHPADSKKILCRQEKEWNNIQ